MACNAKSLKTYLSSQLSWRNQAKWSYFYDWRKKKNFKKKNLLQNRVDMDELGLSPWLLSLQSQKTASLLYNMHMLRIYHTNMKYYVLFRGEEIQNLWIINREPLALEPSLTPKSWLIRKAFCRFLHSLDNDGIKYNSRCSYIFGYRHLAFCLPPSHISEFPRGDF